MDINDLVELSDCTICGGPALLEEENGNGYSVSCMDCGSFTVKMNFKSDSMEDRLEAAKKVASLWNAGKVINEGRNE